MTSSSAPDGHPSHNVIRPQRRELSDFPRFVRSIERRGAHAAGIVKVQPPPGWTARKSAEPSRDSAVPLDKVLRMSVKQAADAPPGVFDVETAPIKREDGQRWTLGTLRGRAAATDECSFDEVAFWRADSMAAVWGEAESKSLTDANVRELNPARLNSVLKHIQDDRLKAAAVAPRLQVGMSGSVRPLALEDMELYQMTLLHSGSPRIWYCVPPSQGQRLERLCRSWLRAATPGNCFNALEHGRHLVSPEELRSAGLDVCRMVQKPGEVVITFPYAYYCWVDTGFNVCESSRFGTRRWLEYGKRHRGCDCPSAAATDGKRLRLNMGLFVNLLQPEKVDLWLAGRDSAPHPEDQSEEAREFHRMESDPQAFNAKVRRIQSDVSRHFITYKAAEGRVLQYDLLKDKLHSQNTLSEEETANFERWKREEAKKVFRTYRVKGSGREICVPDEGECSEEELLFLAEELNLGKLNSFWEVASQLELIAKEERRPIVAYGREMIAEALTESTRTEVTTVQGDVYEHIVDCDVAVVAHNETKEVIAEVSEAAKAMLAVASLPELVDAGVFRWNGRKNFKEIKCLAGGRPFQPFPFLAVERYQDIGDEGSQVFVAPLSRAVVGEAPSYLTGHVDDWIRNGALGFKGSLQLKLSEPNVVAYRIFKHDKSGLEFHMQPAIDAPKGALPEHLEEEITRFGLAELLKSGMLVQVGVGFDTSNQPAENSLSDIVIMKAMRLEHEEKCKKLERVVSVKYEEISKENDDSANDCFDEDDGEVSDDPDLTISTSRIYKYHNAKGFSGSRRMRLDADEAFHVPIGMTEMIKSFVSTMQEEERLGEGSKVAVSRRLLSNAGMSFGDYEEIKDVLLSLGVVEARTSEDAAEYWCSAAFDHIRAGLLGALRASKAEDIRGCQTEVCRAIVNLFLRSAKVSCHLNVLWR